MCMLTCVGGLAVQQCMWCVSDSSTWVYYMDAVQLYGMKGKYCHMPKVVGFFLPRFSSDL